MIPELNQSGVLPPFPQGESIPSSASMAPYETTLVSFIAKYGFSAERRTILRGFLEFRQKLISLGLTNGFQWIDGSFVEDVESNRGRPPADVDIVTFAYRPEAATQHAEWKKLIEQNIPLFTPQLTKSLFFCDAYYVDMNLPPHHLVNTTKYWFGLFSHQRDTFLWKGMLQIPLVCDEASALKLLDQLEESCEQPQVTVPSNNQPTPEPEVENV